MKSQRVTKVILDRKQTAFVEKEGCNGIGVISGTPEEIGEVMGRLGCNGCQIVFDMSYSPNFKRTFNAYVKRAGRIASAAEATLSDPAEYFIDGFRQVDKWVMEVSG